MRRDRTHRLFLGELTRSVLVRIAVVIALIAGALGAAIAPASATASWAIASSPKPFGPPRGGLFAVSCASTTSCVAVGRDAGESTSTEHWNGTIWSFVASPAPGDITSMDDVACPSTTSCYAVGSYDTGTSTKSLLEHWNGTAWSIVTHPDPAGSPAAFLSGVACASTTSCVAVGQYETGSATKTLAERWNGTTWALVSSANPAGSTDSVLNGVSCPSATSCYATGDSELGGNTTTLIEHWNGTNLSIVSSPNPSGTTQSFLGDVSCASDTSCVTVGSYATGTFTTAPLVEQWNGSSWSIASFPSPVDPDSTAVSGVSCVSATSCFAVGAYTDAGNNHHTLAEHFNGTSWSIMTSPGTSAFDVSCPSGTSCFAVGGWIERWNGTSWSVAAPPSGTSASLLTQVACPSTTSCFAVGSDNNGAAVKTLVEQWNGTSWTIVASPNPSGATSSLLNGVACSNPTNCLAVGSSSSQFNTSQTLVEHWDGVSWSIVTSPNPSGSLNDELRGVACPTAARCYAVGDWAADGNPPPSETLVEQWNGTGVSILASPNASGAVYSALAGVSCLSATSCFAAGAKSTTSATTTLVEQWNGTTWSIVASANPAGTSGSEFQGVSCLSATSCVAVGSKFASGDELTLVERWNGTAWSVVASANHGTIQALLLSVSCASASTCFATGWYLGPTGNETLIEHLNGSSWTIMTSPNPPGASDTILQGASCPTNTNCYAVGDSATVNSDGVLIERYG